MRQLQGVEIKGKNETSYVLEERLKSGGYGEVWKASVKGRSVGDKVAIKALVESESKKVSTQKLFYQEGKTMLETLNHPHILKPLELVPYQEEHFLVMPLMQKSLQDYLNEKVEFNSGFIRYVLIGVGSALAYAHSASPAIIHCDVHPGNILFDVVDGKSRVYLTDFGLARVMDESSIFKQAQELSRKSGGGSLEGSLKELSEGMSGDNDSEKNREVTIIRRMNRYIDPEVIASGIKSATPLSDLYSLAIIGEEMNRGKDELGKDKRLDGILGKSTNGISRKRHSSVKEFVTAINALKDYVQEMAAFDPKTLDAKKAAQLYQLVQEAYKEDSWNKEAFGKQLVAIDDSYATFKTAWLEERIRSAGNRNEDLEKYGISRTGLEEIKEVIAELRKIELFYK